MAARPRAVEVCASSSCPLGTLYILAQLKSLHTILYCTPPILAASGEKFTREELRQFFAVYSMLLAASKCRGASLHHFFSSIGTMEHVLQSAGCQDNGFDPGTLEACSKAIEHLFSTTEQVPCGGVFVSSCYICTPNQEASATPVRMHALHSFA